MDEQTQPQQAAQPEPKPSEEAVEDLKPDVEETEGVQGGVAIYFVQLEGVRGEG